MVIDGFTRSANTFATVAFQWSQPRPVRLAHHLHAPAQVIAGAEAGIPVLVPLRAPRQAVISVVIRWPEVSLHQALDAYRRFHEAVLPYRAGCHIATFEQITTDFGEVVTGLNMRFGTAYAAFEHTAENVRRVYDLIDERATHPAHADALRRYVSGLITAEQLDEARGASRRTEQPAAVPEHRVARPSHERAQTAAAFAQLYEAPRLAGVRRDAERVYKLLAST